MTTALDPTGRPVQVGQVVVTSPGLAGRVAVQPPAPRGTRGAALATDALEEALARAELASQLVVEISEAREVAAPGAGLRSTSYGEPGLTVEVPGPGDELGQVMLCIDEAGVISWHLPIEEPGVAAATRGVATRTYVVPRRPGPTPKEPGTRGLAGTLGKKVLTVLVFPLVRRALGAVSEYLVSKWEQSHRPYLVRAFAPGSHDAPTTDPLRTEDWPRLATGRALLFVHGTFSTSDGAFGALPREDLELYHQRYGGRVLAFDHPTVSVDPTANAQWLVEAIPDGTSLDLDVVCHSRGGLVARVLAEKQSRLGLGSRRIAVNRIVFVGTPNAGTVLANPEHMGAMLDTVTNLLEFFPDNAVTDTLEVVLTVLQQIAVGSFKGLDGLTAMTPGGEYLNQFLNTGSSAAKEYHAISSNYEPSDPALKTIALDQLADHVFDQTENDLVVPTRGVYEAQGSDAFPIEEPLELPAEDGVAHTQYFANEIVRAQLKAWLTG